MPDDLRKIQHRADFAGDIALALGGAKRAGNGWRARCPVHDGHDANLSLRHGDKVPLVVTCWSHGCSREAILAELRRRGLLGEFDRKRAWPVRLKPSPSHDDDAERSKRLKLARWLWCNRLPLTGSLGERYLRETRHYGGPFPCTLGFLPGRNNHPPALVAAYALPDEPEPGVLALPDDAVRGVQLIPLTADARKLCKSITIGHCLGSPIVVAPMGDNVGLAITEGLEDALSIAEATGLGAWAAGGGSRLEALADTVPLCTDWVSIFEDDDRAGHDGVNALVVNLLKRGHWRPEQIERVQLGARDGQL